MFERRQRTCDLSVFAAPVAQQEEPDGSNARAGEPSPRPLTKDQELIEHARRGSPAAIRALLTEVAPAVARAVRSIVGAHAPNAADLTQDALMAFVHGLSAYRGEASLVRYASRIAVRVALPECRKNRGRDVLFDHFAGDERLRRGREPTDLFVRIRRRSLVQTLLEDLPEPQAYALAHRVIWGASIEEIAADTGVPINTVRTRLRLAKEAIRKRLAAEPELLELLGGVR